MVQGPLVQGQIFPTVKMNVIHLKPFALLAEMPSNLWTRVPCAPVCKLLQHKDIV